MNNIPLIKVGVIFYHKNINKIYEKRWIEKCVDSILNQTYNNFSIYEINYGGDGFSILQEKNFYQTNFFSIEFENYAEAMNFIISKAFDDGCDYVFNTNLDDYYHNSRIELQLEKIISENLDLVSSDFCYIQENPLNPTEDVITKFMNIPKNNIKEHLQRKHNVIAHPSVCYSKIFWKDLRNRYDKNKVPEEDLDLWIKSVNNGYKLGIQKDILLFYRIHNKQISNRRNENVY